MGRWIAEQRRTYHKGLLKPDQIKYLEKLHFDWTITHQTTPWEVNYEKPLTFKRIQGHCKVLYSYKDKELARWVALQRQMKKKGKLLPEREALLKKAGFIWQIKSWSNNYHKLKKFKEEHGHCRVPRFPKDGRWKTLGHWVVDQRWRYRHHKMEADHLQKLNSLGFTWNMRKEKWQTYYEQLKNFYDTQGHSEVGTLYPTSKQFRVWVDNQRRRKAKLTEEQISLLDALGFRWID